jgi:hypothetical protein
VKFTERDLGMDKTTGSWWKGGDSPSGEENFNKGGKPDARKESKFKLKKNVTA